jgi:hypothetical protein
VQFDYDRDGGSSLSLSLSLSSVRSPISHVFPHRNHPKRPGLPDGRILSLSWDYLYYFLYALCHSPSNTLPLRGSTQVKVLQHKCSFMFVLVDLASLTMTQININAAEEDEGEVRI